MKRKIVKHGDSTLTISLPSKWAKANNLKQGQFLNLEQSNKGLIVSGDKAYFEKIEIILSNDKEWYVNRMLRHLYASGYDEIDINYSTKDQIVLIRKGIEGLPGFEIIESNFKSCRIKCVSSLESAEYEATVKRVMRLILSQLDYFIEDCGNKKSDALEEVNELFKTIFKLTNLCRRLINKSSPYDPVISKYSYRFLTSLMNISSFIIYSYDYVKKTNKLNLSGIENEFIAKTRDFYNRLLLAYQNLNVEKTKSFFEEREAMFDGILELLKDKNPIIIHYFLDILKELSAIGNLILIRKINEEDKT